MFLLDTLDATQEMLHDTERRKTERKLFYHRRQRALFFILFYLIIAWLRVDYLSYSMPTYQ